GNWGNWCQTPFSYGKMVSDTNFPNFPALLLRADHALGVEVVFVAEVVERLVLGDPRDQPAAAPRIRVRARVVDRDLVDERVDIAPRDAPNRTELRRVRHAFAAQPELLVETDGVDDQRVAFVPADRVSEVPRLRILRMRASVHVHHPPRV